MARKSIHGEPKVQRGLSLPRPLYDRISAEADKYGRSWNETVELVLNRAFPVVPDLQNPADNNRNMRADSTLEEAFA